MKPAGPFSGYSCLEPGKGVCAALLLLALLCLSVPAGPAAADDVPLGPHTGLPCGVCHVVDESDQPLVPAALTERQETLCAGCHAGNLGTDPKSSHPTGFVPARALPAAFPLDAEGRLTCSSCHDLHGTAVTLLRGDGGEWPCMACHSQ
jgi:predicted CXXCH cytochrome family protein